MRSRERFYYKNKKIEAFREEDIKGIKVEYIKNEGQAVRQAVKLWIYKKINNELVLINNNQPTFNSKYICSRLRIEGPEGELQISLRRKTITKYIPHRSLTGPQLRSLTGPYGPYWGGQDNDLYFYLARVEFK